MLNFIIFLRRMLQVELENILLSKIWQAQKDKCLVHIHEYTSCVYVRQGSREEPMSREKSNREQEGAAKWN